MVARDDSVIRGSLIACMIFLVLSLALNFFLWRWGDTQATESTAAGDRLRTVQTQVKAQENQLSRLKSMLGIGGFTEAEIEEMRSNAAADEQMQAIEERFAADMAMFGPDVEASERSSVSYTHLTLPTIYPV